MSENNTNPQPQAANLSGPRPQRTFSPRVARPDGSPSSGYQGNRPAGQGYAGQRGPSPSGARSFGGGQRGFGGPGGRFQNKRRPGQEEDKSNLQTKVIQVRRVTRVVKGGKRMRFSALVVIGDLQGQFGVGLKKGNDYADAVSKATSQAKKTMKKFTLDENGSIPYSVTVKFKAAQIFLKPAVSGTGLIAGGPLRGILELAGVRNVLSKIIGSNNKINNVMAVYKALSSFESKPTTIVSTKVAETK